MPELSVRCLMMLKNEDELIRPWGMYHGETFGFGNLFIFDNGSNSTVVRRALDELGERGANVDFTKTEFEHFEGKGELFSSIIRDMDSSNAADFYFPLDCDEFVGVVLNHTNQVSFEPLAIESALKGFLDSPHTLMIQSAFDNSPLEAGKFRPSPEQRKCFFARNACKNLDRGFHVGEANESLERVKTPIIYMHYHYKPIELMKLHSRQKLQKRIKDFSRQAIEEYIEEQGASFHVAGYILEDAEAYYQRFQAEDYINLAAFEERFRKLGLELPFSGASSTLITAE